MHIDEITSLVRCLMATIRAFKFLAIFWEIRLCWKEITLQSIFYLELRKLLIAVRATKTPCCHRVTSLLIHNAPMERDRCTHIAVSLLPRSSDSSVAFESLADRECVFSRLFACCSLRGRSAISCSPQELLDPPVQILDVVPIGICELSGRESSSRYRGLPSTRSAISRKAPTSPRKTLLRTDSAVI